jgi:hypothetical protein
VAVEEAAAAVARVARDAAAVAEAAVPAKAAATSQRWAAVARPPAATTIFHSRSVPRGSHAESRGRT